jgi:uncharacterized protein YebE (UPF0316 family)
MMMSLLAAVPLWLLCVLIFVLRVCDVTLGTVRTLSIVKGHITISVVLGFLEVMIWIVAISEVIVRLHESWFLALAWAGGFAAGNAVGILVERRLALGTSVVRLLSSSHGEEIAKALHDQGHMATTFAGESAIGPVKLVYAMAPRRRVQDIIQAARRSDPDLFYVIEPAHESNGGFGPRLRPVPHATGWRATFKKK